MISIPPTLSDQCAPFVAVSDTSREAAQSIEPHLARLEKQVHEFVRDTGIFGATCDEIEQRLGMSHQTASARLRRLAKAGYVHDSQNRRKTRSGRNAVVWVTGI